jgi:hypothetical protein
VKRRVQRGFGARGAATESTPFQPLCLAKQSLVMKGSAVRIRASASQRPRKRVFYLRRSRARSRGNLRTAGGVLHAGMRRNRLAPLTVVAAVAVLLIPSADAKFRISVTTEPARPIAGSPTRVIMRTEIALAREHGIRLFAVGPWRKTLGQASFEIRLVRIAPRTLMASVRFPYPGRWHLDVPASAASPPLDRWVRVRPRAS